MAVIKIKNLSKHFGSLVAVDNVNLEINEGECFGLLGPNGAGKTSLIRMITAVSPPTRGEIHVLGYELGANSRLVKSMLGVVPQHDKLDPDFTTMQNLTTFARYFDIPKSEAYRRSLEILRLFQLEEKRNSNIRELSGGMKRRLLIARSLINQPKMLVLDEPTIGLDPQAKYLVWEKLVELRVKGVTQLLCTQNMEEASTLCNRVAIMHQGKMMRVDTPAWLIADYAGKTVLELRVGANEKDTVLNTLKERNADYEDTRKVIYIFHADSNSLVEELKPFQPVQRQANLEDVFFRLTGRSLLE